MFVGIGLEGLEEGRRGVYEEHTLPPACRHGGRDREGGGSGEKGFGEKECWVGSDAFLLVRFPSLSLPFGATLRAGGENVSSQLSYTTNITILVSLSSAAIDTRRCRRLIVKYFLNNSIAAPTVTSGPRVRTNTLTFV